MKKFQTALLAIFVIVALTVSQHRLLAEEDENEEEERDRTELIEEQEDEPEDESEEVQSEVIQPTQSVGTETPVTTPVSIPPTPTLRDFSIVQDQNENGIVDEFELLAE